MIRRRWSLTACCFNLMSQLSGWLGCRQMAVYPLLCTNQLCFGYNNGQQSSRWWVYQVLFLLAHMIPWTNCPSLLSHACRRASKTSSGQSSNSILVILCNRGKLRILLQLTEHTVHRHQSDIVRVQANNPIGWGVMAVFKQNCLMIYMIWFPRGEDNSNFWAVPRVAGNLSIER